MIWKWHASFFSHSWASKWGEAHLIETGPTLLPANSTDNHCTFCLIRFAESFFPWSSCTFWKKLSISLCPLFSSLSSHGRLSPNLCSLSWITRCKSPKFTTGWLLLSGCQWWEGMWLLLSPWWEGRWSALLCFYSQTCFSLPVLWLPHFCQSLALPVMPVSWLAQIWFSAHTQFPPELCIH